MIFASLASLLLLLDSGQRLCWIDIQGKCFWQHDPLGPAGNAQCFNLPSRPGSFCLTANGDYVIALETGLAFFDPATEELAPITKARRTASKNCNRRQ